MFNSENRFILLIAMIIMLYGLTGCVTQRDLEYLQVKDINTKAFKEADMADYKLKPYDELYIRITSLDEAAANVYANANSQQEQMGMQPYGASLVSHTISKDGYLQLPLVGNVLIKDMTLSQVSQIITDSLVHILSQPIVNVKLVNRYISVLGEVKTPGHFTFSQEKLTIYDALALAGDMTIYANRQEVLLARNVDQKNIITRIDLTKPEVLESNYYYLRPNDLIYVKPLKKRVWGMTQFPFALILSSITTALLIYTVVK
jgi:polysaccharide biosynthesis/export protein